MIALDLFVGSIRNNFDIQEVKKEMNIEMRGKISMKNNRFNIILKNYNKRRYFTCLFLLLTTYSLQLLAQPTFTTKVSPPKVGRKQRFQVSFDMANANNVDAFTPPTFQGFAVVGGPMQSSYNSNVNGVSTSSSTISYYLQPLKTGRVTIEGAHAIIDGKPMTSNRVTVEVQEKNTDQPADNNPAADPAFNPFNDPFFTGDAPPQPQASTQDRAFTEAHLLRPGESVQKKINDNLFIKVFTNKTTVYEGEPIVATYKVYSRLDMTAGVSKRPSFSGFSAFDMEDPSQSGVMETLNGQNYICYTIRKVQLYPLQSGQLTLEPVEVDCDIKFLKLDNASQFGFDATDTANQKRLQYELKNDPIKITALPLPDNKPANFSGAVGDFTITAATMENEIGKDDATKLQVSISGSGNFSMVQAPAVSWGKTMEAYDPKQKETIDQSVSPMSGTKTFEYVFIIHQPGLDTIPPISFSYFDVATKSYKTISTNQIVLRVLPQSKHPQKTVTDENSNLPAMFISIAKYVLPVMALCLIIYLIFTTRERKKKENLAYLKEKKEKKKREEAWEKLMADTKTNRQNEAFARSASNHESYMPIGFEADVATQPTQKEDAAQTADIQLPESNLLLWLGDNQAFFQALKNDILQGMRNKLNATTNNKNELFDILKNAGKDETILQQLKSIVDECDAVTYSPLQIPPDRHRSMEEAKYLLEKL